MTMPINPGNGRWRRKTHEGLVPERAPRDPAGAAPRVIKVAFHPMRETTLVTVITTALNGHDRWDRRDGTFTVDVPMRDIAGQELRSVLLTLLRCAAEELDR
jgi:hypothetical protein